MRLGEVVELGRHRLMCGDAFNPEHVDLLMRGEKPDMLYCDPPFNINLDTNYSKRYACTGEKSRAKNRAMKIGAKPKSYPTLINDGRELPFEMILERFARCPEQFWWGANNYISRIPNIEKGSWIVWDKRLEERIDRIFGSCFELCWSKKRHRYLIARVQWAGFFGMHGADKMRHHPCQKPVELSEWFLEHYSKEDALVVDLFAGSGSTLLGCERTNRRCLTMELSNDYCDVIIDRYQRMTQQASLLTA